MSRPVTLAAIAGAHGVTGEVRLKLFGQGVEALSRHRHFNDGALTLVKLRDDGKGGAIARFAECTTRAAAEQLRGVALTVPRAALPPLAEGEFYHIDLIDLPVVSETGVPIGRVVEIANYGASDIVEIAREPAPAKGPRRVLVPLVPAAVLGWDAARMVINSAFIDDL